MAINAYTGLMGSGKSYEVVSSVILPAVKSGRRVVSNIDGLNPEAIYRYLEKKHDLDRSSFGQIITVTNEDVCSDNFFPTDDSHHDGKIVQGGDLVAIDEVWRFWGSSHKISNSTMNFFRMHRHFTDPKNFISCDVALMIQDIASLNRNLRAVVEMTSRTVKLKTLGFHFAYRIELYEGHKLTKQSHIDTFNKRYSSAIFPLYKSYASGDGKESVIDKRQNITKNPRIWIGLIFGVLLGSFALYEAISFFHSPDLQSNSPSNSLQTQVPKTNISTQWRIAGEINIGNDHFVVITNPSGRIRLESPSLFQNSGKLRVGDVDGQKVTTWSGVLQSTNNSSFVFPPSTSQAQK